MTDDMENVVALWNERTKKKKHKGTREEAIARILKLLPMTEKRGAAFNEAKKAATTIRKIMDEYGIEIAEIVEAAKAEESTSGGFDWKAFFRLFMTKADQLVDLASSAYLFHAPDGDCFADVRFDGHRETWPLAGKDFKRWLLSRYFDEYESAPGSEAIRTAISMLEAKAQFKGPEHPTYVRVAGHEGKIYIDLADEHWRAIEIDRHGWRLVDEPPVRFRRKDGMRPLPVPVPSSIKTLRGFINIKSDADFALVVSWLIAAFRDRGPYPVLVLAGGQGAAKSTLARILRSLIDPNTASLRALPKEDRELCISAKNAYCLCYDNVSTIPSELSDMLCRVSTGGGIGVRALYTDDDEKLFEGQRPILLNGIGDIVLRPDLADRSIFITLEMIHKHARKTEKDLEDRFEEARPGIMGALLDAVSYGLGHPVIIADKPRMADFAEWMVSCEGSLWEEGRFIRAYCENIDAAVELMIELSPVAVAVVAFMEKKSEWEGTATALLDVLTQQVSEKVAKRKDWPQSGRGLISKLTRAAANLRETGIEILPPDRTETARLLRLIRKGKQPSGSSGSSEAAENRQKWPDGRHDGQHDGCDYPDGRHDGPDGWEKATVIEKPLKNNRNDCPDGPDGLSGTLSEHDAVERKHLGILGFVADGHAPAVAPPGHHPLDIPTELRRRPVDGDPFEELRDESLKLKRED